MKKLIWFILLILLFLFNPTNVSALKLYNLDIDIYIDENGDATITELWDTSLDSGTELYKQMYNLGNSEITDFTVEDEEGTLFTNIGVWDINKSLEQKKHKNGINYTSDGLELCWGMGSYGNHTYKLTYKLSNYVKNLTDSQIIYWQLINPSTNLNAQNFKVTISSSIYFEDSIDVWGYGYKGYAYVKDGKIELSNYENQGLGTTDYVVILAKFPLGTFNASDDLNENFDYYLNMANENKYDYDYDYDYEYDGNYSTFNIANIFFGFFSLVTSVGIIFIIAKAGYNSVSIAGMKRINIKEINNFRDIPCNKNIFEAFWYANTYKLNKTKSDVLGAIMLKWLRDDQIKISMKESLILKKKSVNTIDLTKDLITDNKQEELLYEMLRKASKDKILEENELKNWCSSNYSKFFSWFEDLLKEEKGKMVEKGYMSVTKSKYLHIKKYAVNNEILNEEAIKLAGLKKFLLEFSNMKEKEVIEVKLWEEYLIYAQMLGIAKKVTDQLKKMYPEFIEQTNLDFNSVILINQITSSSVRSASSARSAANSYSGGGGGFSSGGGGGGSFGGGGSSGAR